MTTNQNTAASTNDGSGWRSLIYVPAKVSDDGSNTVIEPATLQVLDQLLLPHTITYITIDTIQKGWDVIHNMNIRGAPLIAIVAILSLGIIDLQCHPTTQNELRQIESMNSGGGGAAANMEDTFDAIQMYIHGKIDYLATSRPTAVNLFNALRDVKELIESLRNQSDPAATSSSSSTPKQRIVAAIVKYAEQMLKNDEADCRAIGDYGAQEIVTKLQPQQLPNATTNKITVMTICNTGSLATANYGTALGVIRSIHHKYEQLEQVVVLETRPYNQGSRLTAFECLQDELPNPILICDNMVTAFINNYKMNDKAPESKKNMVIVVGADRVVANGDTANKIGTYQLAVLASVHHIPFYVAAPTTTLDGQTKQGKDIHIEIRPSIEVIQSSNAPKNMPVWNPAFDVTPAKYITGIITEKGVIHPKDDGTYDIPAFLLNDSNATPNNDTSKPKVTEAVEDITEYTEQTISSLPSYIANNVPDAMKILNVTTADEMEAVEMGDGNLNLVFIVSSKKTNDAADGKQAKIIVKQALPYVRCVGESWPLTLDRAFFEYTALQAQKKACSEYVPNLYYFSKKDALIVMEYLAPPIQILRKGLIAGIRYNTMAYDMGIFCAKTLFRTSGFALSTTELRQRVEFWSTNSMMCALTEQVVFTEPYIVASNNHWTAPFLDEDKKAIETNTELKIAASKWKLKFVTNTEALIHADLHTGSVMCANDKDHQTFVIDPEFAFYGPAAFDTGAFIANLLLSYVSQKAHRSNDNTNSDYDEWILQQIVVFWNTFVEQFTQYWKDPNEYTGFMYDCMKDLLNDDAATMKQCQDEYMQHFLCDTIGFAGMKMLRRIVGIAHVEDLQSITDLELRSACERRGLRIAQHFIVHGCDSSSFKSIEDVVAFVRNTK